MEGNGLLVATGQNEDGKAVMAISGDGQTWEAVDMSATGEPAAFYSVVPGEASFIAVATRFPVLMGMPESQYLYSTDGRTWAEAQPPADCVSAGIVPRGSGFLAIGDRCRTEADFAPGTLHIMESADGRAWTSRQDEALHPGPWATNGDRIVMLHAPGDEPGAVLIDVQISDDGARSWRQVPSPFPEEFHPNGIFLYGHGQYVAAGSQSSGTDNPSSAVCASGDGEAWACEPIDELDGDLEGRNWLARSVAVTPTGFASLVEYVNDPYFGGDGSTDMVQATSTDGLTWTFTLVPEMKDRLPSGIASTSHGLYSWGGLNRDITPDEWVPYLVVRDGTLP